MKSDPFLCHFVGADAVFLDTTYCNPKFTFLSQDESIEYIVNTIGKIMGREERSSGSVLFLISTYVIGKEKILLEVSRQLNCALHVDARKMKILRASGLGDPGIFTEDAKGSCIHVIGWNLLGETWPYFRPNFVKMREIMLERGYSKAVGFVPSGWMYEKRSRDFPVRVKDSLEIHLVPYSEHSSYEELREYVRFLRPKRVIPTVGMEASKLDSKHGLLIQKHFANLVNETANKKDFLMGFFQRMNDADGRDENQPVVQAIGGEGGIKDNNHTSRSQDPNILSNDEMERNMQELRDCLPPWVTQDQLLRLLNDSSGDIIEAVSGFYECETELYKEANAGIQPFLSSLKSSSDCSAASPEVKSTQKDPDSSSQPCLGRSKNLTGRVLDRVKPASPSKRGTTVCNKAKKKGRAGSKLQLSGCNQSTITEFFGKLSIGKHPTNGKGSQVGSVNELNDFLLIINGGMPRNAATALLEKTRWDINAALDHYYTDCVTVTSDDKESVLYNMVSEQCGNTICKTEKEINSLEGTTNFPSLAVKEISTEESVEAFISLPLEKYSPVEHACWKAGEPAPYLHLARTFNLVEKEKGKIKTICMLCNMFRSLLALSPEDVLPAVYLCTNKIAPDHENMELNIGGGLVTTALEQTCGIKRSKIRELYNELGDLGDVAQYCRQTQSLLILPRPLLIQDLFSVFKKISLETGSGSLTRKKHLILYLMRSCREMEMKFLVRTLVRNLRIGAMMRTILPALAQAVVLNEPFSLLQKGSIDNLKVKLQEISSTVAEAYNILPNLDLLVPALLSRGSDFSSSTLEMVPGSPILPMLAKYDGQRAQIHRLADGSIRVFSRNMSETTSKFPDLVNLIKELCKPSVSTFILDAEVVGVDRKSGNRLMSFQQLSSRERGGRDSAVSLETIKVDICIFMFDIMFYDGKQLLSLPLRQRRKYLEELFHEKPGYLEHAREIMIEAAEASFDDKNTLAKMNSFLEGACKSSCEGIIAKSLDVNAGYAPSKRSDAWLKVKRDYVDELGDSLDLVPIGAWYGNGRKAGWYSPFLLACYKPSTEEFQSVCRVMSGFSDSFYIEMKAFFWGDKILSRKPPYYLTDESPDVWFPPELVWEIRGADMTISPVHHAAIGLVHPSRGISMRFPRFVCSVPDRRPEDCSTDMDIADIFASQTRKMDVSLEE
ncbi:unnamed protein product [Spirodela intermedia]|uniref:DNA ligase (ATP) n=1 Tax=Spirodela intermedia TaxID=51605 RepID=A0A7I8J5C7_SPIIN|nr:unnamed protein product [Spirodela intermedia]CAA6665437.1 unnamed protein product [Spirodela intermedia]